jgi:glycine amidinotransferase
VVNVYTEWGKLKEAVVGSSVNYNIKKIDISFQLMYSYNLRNIKDVKEPIKKYIEEREEDLSNLQILLEGLGVKVFRPEKLNEIKDFKTPNWAGVSRPVDNPRDQVLILGNEIIETSCMQRNRYFENDLLKSIFYKYFEEGSKWTCAPRPTLTDNSFDYSYSKMINPNFYSNSSNKPESFEIIFDAAQCLKFGKDIVMNVSTKNHLLGAEWLRRHLDGRFRIHTVNITDNHIDSMFMPLRPGVLLINQETMPSMLHLLPEPLRKWDTLISPEKAKFEFADDATFLASNNINVNILPIDEEHILVNDYDLDLVKLLEKNKFIPIPIKLRHSQLFGGGIHCSTLDTVREEVQEDYFS